MKYFLLTTKKETQLLTTSNKLPFTSISEEAQNVKMNREFVSLPLPVAFLSLVWRTQRKRINILLLKLTLLSVCMGVLAASRLCVFSVLICLLIAVGLVCAVLGSEIAHLRIMHATLTELCRNYQSRSIDEREK